MKEVNKRNRRRQECNANQSMRVGIGRGWVGGGAGGLDWKGVAKGVCWASSTKRHSRTHTSQRIQTRIGVVL